MFVCIRHAQHHLSVACMIVDIPLFVVVKRAYVVVFHVYDKK